ncbi:spore cortex biosynthesis protein YabQ [Bacillus salitolerans]|uniref:Spore cortex biosynthesis protein YabQ n=1 Tax=Bacillus salitolerans TaxID=1437434 RepID=A0ABW4LP18_9BACI
MSLTIQFYTMLAMIGMGSWIGAALDTYGRFLKRPTRARWFVFINDVFFWIVQGLVIFYILLLVNEGELRFYVFLALLCGYAAYKSLFQSYYNKLLEFIITTVIKLYKFLAKLVRVLIIRPIQLLIQATIVVLVGLWNILLKILILLIKICFTPIKWIGIILWKLVPKKIKMFFSQVAGFFKQIKNLKTTWKKFKDFLKKWWTKFRS